MQLQKKTQFQRLLQVLVPLVILIGIILVSAGVKKTPIGPDADYTFAKATVTEVLEDYSGGEPFRGLQLVKATVTSGEYKGRVCQLQNPNDYQSGAYCVPGTQIIALVHADDDGSLAGSVYNYDRTGMVYLLLGLFALILIAVGGRKGAAALYALVFTFVCVICVFIPLVYGGMNAVLAAIVTAILILVASIYIINGWSRKTLGGIIGTTVGVAISGLLAMLVGGAWGISGFHGDEAESLIYLSRETSLDVAGILYAGVLISSLGAVMDVSVSIVAAMEELKEKAPRLRGWELFHSGMRVGRDMMGTMSNTLILAYTGSATAVLLRVYAYDMPYLQMMGYNSIVIEILCGLCGTIGVILTVPIQAAVSTVLLRKKK